MRAIILLFFIGSFAIAGLMGCENCGPSAEPLTTFYINTTTATTLDTVFATGSLRPVSRQEYQTSDRMTYHRFSLPLNLTTDSTRYVVQLSGKRDTITVFYQRKTAYRNRNCGYVLSLDPPLRGTGVRVSRGKVTSINYIPNQDGSFLGQSATDAGIQLFWKL